MADPQVCALESCAVVFDAEGNDAVIMEATIDGKYVELFFCSIAHIEQWHLQKKVD
jgi:hypothetical protein